MTHSNEALSRLRGITLEDLTAEQMDSVLGPSSISPQIISQFEQASLLADAVAAQRTYCGGVLPIPELGAVETTLINPLESAVIRPSGTEVWDIKNINAQGQGGTATITFSYTDGVSDSVIESSIGVGTVGKRLGDYLNDSTSPPWLITNSLYLKIEETGGAFGVGLFVARQVVGQ